MSISPRQRLNLVLGIVLVALAVLVWRAQQPPPAAEITRLTNLREADITRIEVRTRGAETAVLERRGGEWRLVAPFDLPADDDAVRSLLGLVRAPSLARYPATAIDPAEVGLDTPSLSLRVGPFTLELGGTELLHGRRYVRVGDHVNLILDRYSHRLRGGPARLVSPELLPGGVRLRAIDLPGLRLREADGQWHAEGQMIPAERLRSLAEAWEQARALRVERLPAGTPIHGDAITLQPVGKAPPIHLILQWEDDAAWLLRPDLGLRYRFTREAAEHLLQPPAAPPAEPDA